MEKIMNTKNLNNNIVKVIVGSLISIILTIIMLFIYAGILVSTDVKESTMKPIVIAISGFSIIIGSFISSLKLKKKGIINGAIVGIIYICTIYILSSIALVGFSLNIDSMIMMVASIICGMFGGVIGVNISGK